MAKTVALDEGSEEFKRVKAEWAAEAKACTLQTLPDFLKKLTENYSHDYGTICHAASAAAIAAACAVDKSDQGGITGFQAGAIMWEFIREWDYSSNKTGLKLVDYDNFLYPQYAHHYDKTISPEVWAALQEQAAAKLEEADKDYAQFETDLAEYEISIAEFVARYPDYHERRDHYDHLGFGTSAQHEAYQAKKSAGFEFAPQQPFEPINGISPVYKHWESIVAGHVPFGYRVEEQ